MERRTIVFLAFLVTGMLLAAGCTGGQPGTITPEPGTTLPVRTVPASPAPVTSPAPQATIIPNETLVAFVNEAAAYVAAHGKADALATFSDRNGSFVRGELYIFAYDFNGTTLAHPVNPEKIGVNRLNETQGNVGIFLANMSAVARNGTGFYRSSYINPARNRTLESKLGYAQKIDDTWWIGSGVYTGPA